MQHALIFDDHPEIAVMPDSTACAVCDAILFFDGDLDEQRRTTFDEAWPGQLGLTLAASGDALYGLQTKRGDEPPEEFEDEPPFRRTLLARTPDGGARWELELGPSETPLSVAAGPEGSYVFQNPRQNLGSPSAITAFDVTGGSRWSRAAEFDVLAPDGAGGVVLATGGFDLSTGPVEAQLERLDASGTSTWIRRWQAAGKMLHIEAVAAGPGGTLAVVGSAEGSPLDLGEATIDIGPHSSFVALLEPDGTTRWAFAVGPTDLYDSLQVLRVATDGDKIILTGEYNRSSGNLGLGAAWEMDGFLAVIDAGGVVRATALGGPGGQGVYDLQLRSDGVALLHVISSFGDAGVEQLQIGSYVFEAHELDQGDPPPQGYVIAMRP